MSAGGLALSSRSTLKHDVATRTDHPHPRHRQRPRQLDPWSAAWLEHVEQYTARLPVPPRVVCERECQRELVFCLLGGHGVTYELALSAADVLTERGALGDCGRSGDRLQRWLQDLLDRPWYAPAKLDGTGRRYRYPKRKAMLLRQADDWLHEHAAGGLFQRLAAIPEETDRRTWVCGCPGVGPKTASWLLRNIGLGERLAIIDVHLLRALQASGRAGSWRLPEHYLQLEQAFLDWSASLSADPAAFDLFLWEYQRGDVT